jgi:hypothetical protein
MATPAKTSSNLPATTLTPAEPVSVVGPLGWILVLTSGIGLLLATWMLYPTDYDGMWAGYRDSLIATVVILGAMALNTSLPKRPTLGLLGLSGILLVLFGVFLDNPTEVFLAEVVSGALVLAGAGMIAAGLRD